MKTAIALPNLRLIATRFGPASGCPDWATDQLFESASRLQSNGFEDQSGRAKPCKRCLQHVESCESDEQEPPWRDPIAKAESGEDDDTGEGENSAINIHKSYPSCLLELCLGCRQGGLDPAVETRAGLCAGLMRNLMAVMVGDQRRHAANPEACGGGLVFIRVQFEKANAVGELASSLIIGRCHHPAGTAPGRPDIDNEGTRVARLQPGEPGAIYFHRVRGRERRRASPAFPRGQRPSTRRSVQGAALVADEGGGRINGCRHRCRTFSA